MKKSPSKKKPNNSAAITARKRAEGKSLGGRPPFSINYTQLEKLCGYFSTGDECAAILGCSYETLNLRLQQDYQEAFEELNEGKGEDDLIEYPHLRCNGFKEYFKKRGAKTTVSLRRAQLKMALGKGKGNSPDKGMLIWMGKNHLGQTDRFDHTSAGDALAAGATGLDLTQLSDEQFKQFGELLKMARERAPDAEEKIPAPKDMH